MDVIASERHVDLEAWETGMRRAVLLAGAGALEGLLEGIGRGRRGKPLSCVCGQPMRSQGVRSKSVYTMLGRIGFRRSRFVCGRCGRARCPGDELLGVVGTGFSPGVRRLMARAGGLNPFGRAREDLEVYAEIRVSTKDVERVSEGVGADVGRWMRSGHEQAVQAYKRGGRDPGVRPIPTFYISFDGTGVPMCRRELVGRKGKQPDGTAKTREVKLGCIFTQTILDPEGRPVRDPASTTYVGAIETSEAFGWRLLGEALRRGLAYAQRVVVIADGAACNKVLAQMHFPDAVFILDLYHAREHLATFCKGVFCEDQRHVHEERWRETLDAGDIERLTAQMTRYVPRRGPVRAEGLRQIAYFTENAPHMRYADFQARGFFVGSGVIEAGCKTLIGQRLKESGMHWTVRGANAIIALQCCLASGLYEQYWEDRSHQ